MSLFVSTGVKMMKDVKVEIKDLTFFVENPPQINDMILKEKDSRKRKNKILIIVPSFHENFRLKYFLKKMKEQKVKNFDVCLILASDDRYVNEPRMQLYQIKRKWDCGFAGAVYLGQKIALRDGYRYFLFTDIDRLPFKSDSIYILYKQAEEKNADVVCGKSLIKGYFLPKFRYKDAYLGERWFVPLFCLIKTSVLQKIGFYALPLYMGYDDTEFEVRILNNLNNVLFLNEKTSSVYIKPKKYAFINIAKEKTFDHQYTYEMILCTTNWPQTADINGLFRKVKTIFFELLTFEFIRLRIPSLGIVKEMALQGKFGKIRLYNIDNLIEHKTTKARELEKIEAMSSRMDQILKTVKLIELILFGKKQFMDNNSFLIEFFLSESFYVYDEQKNKTLFFRWKKRISLLKRIKTLYQTILETLILIIRVELSKIKGSNGIFWKYGLLNNQIFTHRQKSL